MRKDVEDDDGGDDGDGESCDGDGRVVEDRDGVYIEYTKTI